MGGTKGEQVRRICECTGCDVEFWAYVKQDPPKRFCSDRCRIAAWHGKPRKRSLTEESPQGSTEPQAGIAYCPICSKAFSTAQGMGGHLSKCKAKAENAGLMGFDSTGSIMPAHPKVFGSIPKWNWQREWDAINPAKEQASISAPADHLVTVRLNATVDGRTLKDAFQWNIAERAMTPEMFARVLCHDLELQPSFEAVIASSIREQVCAHTQHLLRVAGEHRVVVKLDVRVANEVLRDQFEWDLANPANDPETFAQSLCADLGLGPDFVVAVSHAVREQLNEHSTALLTKPREQKLRKVVPDNCVRDPHELDDWAPFLDEMTEEELTKAEKHDARQARILARESRGGVRGTGAASQPETQMVKIPNACNRASGLV